jgi:hypothetical protein
MENITGKNISDCKGREVFIDHMNMVMKSFGLELKLQNAELWAPISP